jgi:hypothetical protein
MGEKKKVRFRFSVLAHLYPFFRLVDLVQVGGSYILLRHIWDR